ncbi:MAG: class I SAM-dependent methyltransferase [Chloroflexi bacterium]|nr:class I SAM-dependent methyltransferase [Chloroflexota bacterium]
MKENVRQEKERALWEKMAAGYDHSVMTTFEEAYALSISKTAAVLSPDSQVLEIGCGTGIVSLGVAPQAGKVTGVDISPSMIEIAQNKAGEQGVSNVEFQVYDGYSLPFDDGAFDAVLLFNLLHVVKEPGTLIKESYRLLKPGGWLVTATDCYAAAVPISKRLMLHGQWLLKVFGVIPFLHYYQKQDVDRLISRGGFTTKEEAVLHSIPMNYFVLAQKNLNLG